MKWALSPTWHTTFKSKYPFIQFVYLSFQFGRTEKIKNNLNPKFTKSIDVDYHFENVQKLQFCVFDIDNETSTLGDDDVSSDKCNVILARYSSTKTV